MGASSENPYASPATKIENTEPLWKRRGKISLLLVMSSVLLFGAALALVNASATFGLAHLLIAVSAIAAMGAVVFAARTLTASSATSSTPFVFLVTLVGGIGGLFMTVTGAMFALLLSSNFSRGRQLRRRGKVLLAAVDEKNPEWTGVQITLEIPVDQRVELAKAWRENGRTEHASVAAFARLTTDLMTLGAPPDLIASSSQDALDEIRHTELCFSLARAIDGRAMSPARFPEAQHARTLSRFRKLALAELAVDSLIDGALHEGVSARVIAKLVRKCESPQIKAILKEIAADEGRHAAHGWDVVEWCLDAGGVSVARALLGAARALPIEMRAPLPSEAEHGDWERFGIMGRTLESDEYAKARADVVRRVETTVANYLRPAANSSTTHTLPSTSVSAATPM